VHVSEVALDAAEAAAKIYPEVNSQKLLTRRRSAVDASAPSERQALNTLRAHTTISFFALQEMEGINKICPHSLKIHSYVCS